MVMPSEELELSSQTLRGATVSIEYRNAQSILRTEQRNPNVVFEVYSDAPGILSGINEVLPFLRARLPASSSAVFSLSDGDEIFEGETLLRIVAPYAAFGMYRDVITGIFASSIGWATAARACVRAAGENQGDGQWCTLHTPRCRRLDGVFGLRGGMCRRFDRKRWRAHCDGAARIDASRLRVDLGCG